MSAADAQALQNQLARQKDEQTKLLLLQEAADKAQKRSTTNIIIGSVDRVNWPYRGNYRV